MNYNEQLQKNGAIVGEGLQALASIAASAGNSLDLSQGYHELAASNRSPLHPGHNANIDRLQPAAYLNAAK